MPRNDFKDKIVVDVGCGSGILSLFAAKAGAKRVYAIEASGVAEAARKIIEKNGMQGVVRGWPKFWIDRSCARMC